MNRISSCAAVFAAAFFLLQVASRGAESSALTALAKGIDANGKPVVGEFVSEDEKTLSLLDLKTGQKVTVAKELFNRTKKNITEREAGSAMGVPQFLAWKIRNILPQDVRGKVATIELPLVYVSVGSINGIAKGQELEVFRNEEEVKNPDTGEVLGVKQIKIASLIVTETQDKFSKATLASRPGGAAVDLHIGDEVALSSPRRPIAVLPFVDLAGNVQAGGKKLSEDIITGLVQGGIPVVERSLLSKDLLDPVLQNSVDTGQMQKLGRQLGAQALLIGTLNRSGSASEATIRLIKVETGEVLFATVQDGPALGTTVARPASLLPVGKLPNCCRQALQARHECAHKCCIEAKARGLVCPKCGPSASPARLP